MMPVRNNRMQDPNKLDVAARARSLAVDIYRATASFPATERFGLSAQMRRAAVSVGSNIHEGCGRSGLKELIHFLHIALGSVGELEFQILIAGDLGFLEDSSILLEELNHTKRMLLRLIAALRRRSRGA